MRVGAGYWKGRRLEVPAGARPTSGRARAALFNLLQDHIAGARVLDLYAGSGSIGIEAVSRGAARAVLVEKEPAALSRSLERLGAPLRQIRLVRGTAAQALRAAIAGGERFDLVFSDPPYRTPLEEKVGDAVAEVLAEGGLFILQQDALQRQVPKLRGLTLLQQRAYGRNVFYIFRKSEVFLTGEAGDARLSASGRPSTLGQGAKGDKELTNGTER